MIVASASERVAQEHAYSEATIRTLLESSSIRLAALKAEILLSEQ